MGDHMTKQAAKRTRAGQKELHDRRLHHARLMMQGATPREAAETLSQKYGTSLVRLMNDWRERNKWEFDIVDQRDNDKIIQDHIFAIGQLKRRLWEVVLDSPTDKNYHGYTDKEKKDAIDSLMDAEFKGLHAGQTLGQVVTAETKITIEQRTAELRSFIETEVGDDRKKQEEIIGTVLKYAKSKNAN